jgi:transcriptional regulator with XRE-family HTH domain/mannose-6-phosphate isomerase-like protein (cupin superfamily)
MTTSPPGLRGYTPRVADEPSSRSVDLGPNIRARRTEHGLSLRELARRVGVSASALSQIENGHSRPSVDTLYELARQLGVTPDEIFFGPTPGEPNGTGTGDAAAAGAAAPLSVVHGLDAHLSEVLELVPRAAQQVVTLKGGEICRQIGGHSLPGVDCLLITYEAGAASPGPEDFVQHAGHEFNYVVAGEIEVHVRDKRYRLARGDSLTFPSDWPHRVTNPTDTDSDVMCLFVRGS